MPLSNVAIDVIATCHRILATSRGVVDPRTSEVVIATFAIVLTVTTKQIHAFATSSEFRHFVYDGGGAKISIAV